MSLKLKVCGMKNADEITRLSALSPDFIGFIFYKKSKRFAELLSEETLNQIPKHIKKVGVFVNEELALVKKIVSKCNLDFVQLHGDEDLGYCEQLVDQGIKIIKVFRVSSTLPDSFQEFDKVADYFLFDTSTDKYGGSGKHFDWTILEGYDCEKPFLLSGGISLEDIEMIKSLKFPKLIGLDVNSRFEIEPGRKNIELLTKLKEAI